MQWRILIDLDDSCVTRLCSVFVQPELTIRQEGDENLLLSNRFDELTRPGAVFDKAVTVAALASGAATVTLGLDRPIQVLKVLEHDHRGHRQINGFRPPHKTRRPHPADTCHHPVYRWIARAEWDREIAEVLVHLSRPLDWSTLLTLYGTMKHDLTRHGLDPCAWGVSVSELRAFESSAAASLAPDGPDKVEPVTISHPPWQMPLHYAREMIKSLAFNWLNRRCALAHKEQIKPLNAANRSF